MQDRAVSGRGVIANVHAVEGEPPDAIVIRLPFNGREGLPMLVENLPDAVAMGRQLQVESQCFEVELPVGERIGRLAFSVVDCVIGTNVWEHSAQRTGALSFADQTCFVESDDIATREQRDTRCACEAWVCGRNAGNNAGNAHVVRVTEELQEPRLKVLGRSVA